MDNGERGNRGNRTGTRDMVNLHEEGGIDSMMPTGGDDEKEKKRGKRKKQRWKAAGDSTRLLVFWDEPRSAPPQQHKLISGSFYWRRIAVLLASLCFLSHFFLCFFMLSSEAKELSRHGKYNPNWEHSRSTLLEPSRTQHT